jgi:hypothetical protein
MEISLGNKILNIKFNIYKSPNLKKLEKELSNYFSNHDVCGNKIESFELDNKTFSNVIVPKHPHLEGCLTDGDYVKDLYKIGEKYGIENLHFIHWCYGK